MNLKQSQQTDSLHGELETSLQESKKPSRRFEWKVLAICLTLAIVIGSTAFAIAAEAKEYNQAIAFFEENGLSANELNRSDVKAVYRDITEKKVFIRKNSRSVTENRFRLGNPAARTDTGRARDSLV